MKDGTEASNEVLGETCSTLTNQVFTSTARWMWIQFKSDGAITTSGLTGTLSTVYAGILTFKARNQFVKSYETLP